MTCESMVYLNQIFSNTEASSGPLAGELTADNETFLQQLSFFDPIDEADCDCDCNCGCGCSSTLPVFDGDLNFVVESTQVFITDFTLSDPESFSADNITVNGIAVDNLTRAGNRFTVATDTFIQQVSDCQCLEANQSTKAALLIQGAGPWVAKLTIIVYGSVFGCGSCKRFKLVLTTRDGISIDIPGISAFSAPELCLPCKKGGIAPDIQFSFLANATLLNPIVTADNTDSCNVTLTAILVAEPAVSIQVTRQTLFAIDADAVPQPCDDLTKCIHSPGTCTCHEDFPIHAGPCCNDGCNTPAPQICCQFNGVNGCSM